MSISAATTTGLVFRNKFMNNNFAGICTTNSFFACFARRAAIVEKLVFAPTDDRSPPSERKLKMRLVKGSESG